MAEKIDQFYRSFDIPATIATETF